MPAPTLEATVRQAPGAPDLTIVDMRGEINSAAEGELRAAYAQVARYNPSVILLNLADVTYINSTGIALIVGLLGQARRDNRRLAVCGLSPHYVEIFSITRLVDYMTIYPDVSSALAAQPAGTH